MFKASEEKHSKGTIATTSDETVAFSVRSILRKIGRPPTKKQVRVRYCRNAKRHFRTREREREKDHKNCCFERADGLPHKIAGKIDAGIIGEELVRNELMGSSDNGMSERRITAPWCGSRGAGWRVAVGKTTVSLADITSLASEASLVSPEKKWNMMVPRMDMTMTLRKWVTNVTPATPVFALTALLVQMAPRASMASEECVVPMALMATMASMASMVVSMTSMAPMALMVLAPMGFDGLVGLGDSSKMMRIEK